MWCSLRHTPINFISLCVNIRVIISEMILALGRGMLGSLIMVRSVTRVPMQRVSSASPESENTHLGLKVSSSAHNCGCLVDGGM